MIDKLLNKKMSKAEIAQNLLRDKLPENIRDSEAWNGLDLGQGEDVLTMIKMMTTIITERDALKKERDRLQEELQKTAVPVTMEIEPPFAVKESKEENQKILSFSYDKKRSRKLIEDPKTEVAEKSQKKQKSKSNE